jgi:hypothetical protein
MAARRRTAEQQPMQKASTSGRQYVSECEHIDNPMWMHSASVVVPLSVDAQPFAQQT